MFAFIKAVIDSLRNPEGEVVAAVEITLDNRQELIDMIGDSKFNVDKYAKIGDFVVVFEREDVVSICPAEEFHKRYYFLADPIPGSTDLIAVNTKSN